MDDPDDLSPAEMQAFVGIPSPFPTDPKKIRARIRSYERKLAKEKQLIGSCDDGYGKRFLLGPLYMLVGDVEGALKHYEWFEREFEERGIEPFHLITWCLALYKAGRLEDAREMVSITMDANRYLVPLLLGENPQEEDGWHGSNYEWLSYAKAFPRDLVALWDREALDWLREMRAEE